MAASTSQKSPCATCRKVTGMFTCRGCQQDFCTRHVAEHRQELGKQMDELTVDHDRFRQNLMEQTKEPGHHPLIKQIDEWEQQSIDKIRHTAHDARKQLEKTIKEHTTKLTVGLTKIADELRRAREDDDFFETDLKQWMEKLDQLKNDLAQLPSISIRQEDNNAYIPFLLKITKEVSTKETFEKFIGDIQIEDNGQVIVKTQGGGHTGVRGGGEYTSGQHRFRFKIEECDARKWIFIGIVSKDVALEENSYGSPSSYGWGGSSQVFLSGARDCGFNGYKSDIEKNDIIELFIDCDQRMIRLTNERTQSVYELSIETSKCPFPWQLNFDLYYNNDRVRILQT